MRPCTKHSTNSYCCFPVADLAKGDIHTMTATRVATQDPTSAADSTSCSLLQPCTAAATCAVSNAAACCCCCLLLLLQCQLLL
jgi:hypothetical protein